jgi:hypothetical protein
MEQWLKLPSVRKADVTPSGGTLIKATAKRALQIVLLVRE